MKRIITYSSFNRAVQDVAKELSLRNLMYESSKLHKTEVYYCLTQVNIAGSFIEKESLLSRIIGFNRGNIYISAIPSLWEGKPTFSLRDVIRHEYGHAIAFWYPDLIQRSQEFKRLFAGSYNGKRKIILKDVDYISDYAMESPAEDFAETVMFILKGRFPKNISYKIEKKIAFVEKVFKLISAREFSKGKPLSLKARVTTYLPKEKAA